MQSKSIQKRVADDECTNQDCDICMTPSVYHQPTYRLWVYKLFSIAIGVSVTCLEFNIKIFFCFFHQTNNTSTAKVYKICAFPLFPK